VTTELVLAAQTASTEDFQERVSAAAAAGFSGIGLRPRDYAAARAAGATVGDLRAVLDEHGVRVVELEVLHHWAMPGDVGERSRVAEQRFYAMAEALGGRHLMANSELPGSAHDAAAPFAALCDRAAEHGLLVVIEFLPWTSVPDAGTAWEIARIADRPNGGVLVDSWHHFRGAADDAQLLAVPPERNMAVQIDDAAADPVGALYDDTVHNRLLPGQGTFDLVHFVQVLDAHGVRAPYSVEVLSDRQRALPAATAAARAGEATRQVLAAARGRVG